MLKHLDLVKTKAVCSWLLQNSRGDVMREEEGINKKDATIEESC